MEWANDIPRSFLSLFLSLPGGQMRRTRLCGQVQVSERSVEIRLGLLQTIPGSGAGVHGWMGLNEIVLPNSGSFSRPRHSRQREESDRKTVPRETPKDLIPCNSREGKKNEKSIFRGRSWNQSRADSAVDLNSSRMGAGSGTALHSKLHLSINKAQPSKGTLDGPLLVTRN